MKGYVVFTDERKSSGGDDGDFVGGVGVFDFIVVAIACFILLSATGWHDLSTLGRIGVSLVAGLVFGFFTAVNFAMFEDGMDGEGLGTILLRVLGYITSFICSAVESFSITVLVFLIPSLFKLVPPEWVTWVVCAVLFELLMMFHCCPEIIGTIVIVARFLYKHVLAPIIRAVNRRRFKLWKKLEARKAIKAERKKAAAEKKEAEKDGKKHADGEKSEKAGSGQKNPKQEKTTQQKSGNDNDWIKEEWERVQRENAARERAERMKEEARRAAQEEAERRNREFEDFYKKHYSSDSQGGSSNQNGGNGSSESGQTARESTADYFTGCNDKESLTRRYHQLMKIFHPDNQNGDNGMAVKIQDEYNRLSKIYS